MMDHLSMRDSLGDGDFLVNGQEFDEAPAATIPFAMGSDDNDIERLFHEETNSNSFNLNDTELLNLMSHEQSSIPGSDIALNNILEASAHSSTAHSSLDNLVNMPMVEIEGADAAMVLDMQRGGAQNAALQGLNMQNKQSDPLLGTLMNQNRGMSPQMQGTQANRGQNPNIAMQMMEPIQNPGPGMFQPPSTVPTQGQSQTVDLQREKLKLLSKWNEINKRQMQNTSNNMMPPPQRILNQQQMMQQMNNIQMQQKNMMQQQQIMQMRGVQPMKNKATLSNAVGSMSLKDAGESPLTSFLRAKGPSQAFQPSVTTSKSSASVFGREGVSLDPFNKGRPNSQHQLLGIMDRSVVSHNMVKQLKFMTTDASGRNITQSAVGSPGNEKGGGGTSETNKVHWYRYSGILPKHASDGHLLRAKGLGRWKGKAASVSKDNMLSNFARSKGLSPSRDSLHGIVTKNSSKKLKQDDLFGTVPRKGRNGNVKYKFGQHGSVGNLAQTGKGSQGDANQSQGNAMW
jgi:hypothetical protein